MRNCVVGRSFASRPKSSAVITTTRLKFDPIVPRTGVLFLRNGAVLTQHLKGFSVCASSIGLDMNEIPERQSVVRSLTPERQQ